MKIRTPLENYGVVFWNCNGKDSDSDLQKCLSEIVCENDVKIVSLCECKSSALDILIALQKINNSFMFVGESDSLKDIGCIRLFSTLPKGTFTVERKSNRFLTYAFFDKYDLCFVHLKSILSITDESKTMEDLAVIEQIRSLDKSNQMNLKKFIIGDFNSMPYSNSLVNSRLFNAVRYREIKNSCHRKKTGCNRYINPCWELLGQKNAKIYGTIHHTTSEYYNLGTYLFDQVIFDKELVNNYDEDSLKIITSTRNHILVSPRGIISDLYSDHLPIFFKIKG